MKIQYEAITSMGNVAKNKEAYKYTNPILFDEIEKSEDRVKKINKELDDARSASKIKDKEIEKGFTGGGDKKIKSPELKKMKLSESLFEGVKFEDDEEDEEDDEESDGLWNLNNKVHQNVEDLKLMHEAVRTLNNENAYFNSWVTAFPDEPKEEDFIIIAEDEDSFNEISDLFNSILIDFIDDGLNNPSESVMDFIDGRCSMLGCGEYDVEHQDNFDDEVAEEIRESFDDFVESGMGLKKSHKFTFTEDYTTDSGILIPGALPPTEAEKAVESAAKVKKHQENARKARLEKIANGLSKDDKAQYLKAIETNAKQYSQSNKRIDSVKELFALKKKYDKEAEQLRAQFNTKGGKKAAVELQHPKYHLEKYINPNTGTVDYARLRADVDKYEVAVNKLMSKRYSTVGMYKPYVKAAYETGKDVVNKGKGLVNKIKNKPNVNEELDEELINEGAEGVIKAAEAASEAAEVAQKASKSASETQAAAKETSSGLDDVLNSNELKLDPFETTAEGAALPFEIAAGAIDTFTKAQAARRGAFRQAVRGLKY